MTSGFKSFASAIGLRKKSHAADDADDRRRPPVAAIATPPYAGRPPSHSVSSTVRSDSLEDERGPKTPSDGPRTSLMTLGDDPFAARIGDHDRSRLSAYSSTSGHDSLAKQTHSPLVFHNARASYASSSSASRDTHPPSPSSPNPDYQHRSVGRGSFSSTLDSGRAAAQNTLKTHFASASAVTLTDKNRFSHPEIPPPQPRPPMRARGMTDVGGGQTIAQFLREDLAPPVNPKRPSSARPSSRSYNTSPPPKLVVRQASVCSRNSGPPSAPPPKLDLPPTPHQPSRSSPLSAIKSNSPSKSVHGNSGGSDGPSSPHAAESSGPIRTLKKAASQQSLSKKGSLTHVPSIGGKLNVEEKAPRKQRSFNHPRLPLPTLPTSSSSSSSTPPSSSHAQYIHVEKRGSVSSRKRLFSGGSRTLSPNTPEDEDTRSEHVLPNSFWDEELVAVPSSPTHSPHHHHHQEYTPQRIMSPAEMLKVEESVMSGEDYIRPRGMSITSLSSRSEKSSTGPHDVTFRLPGSVFTPPPPPPPTRSLSFAIRSSNPMDKSFTPQRPSTADQRSAIPPPPPPSSVHQTTTMLVSLPPPPRRRANSRSSIASKQSQSPHHSQQQQHTNHTYNHRPPSISRNVSSSASSSRSRRSTTTEEYARYRKSILRKPSFLDIEDDSTDSKDCSSQEMMPDNFLDLRPSIDTVRSIEMTS